MCNCLLEALECPAKVLCCCCECACKLILGVICSLVIGVVVIGLIVYFAVFYHKNNHDTEQVQKTTQRMIREIAPQNFRHFFRTIN